MSAPIVQARYQELEQIAAHFAAAAEEQQALQERVNRQVEVLRSGSWQGKGVAAFLGEMDGEVRPAGQRLIVAMHRASETTLECMYMLKLAEMDAASLFQQEGREPPQDSATGNGSNLRPENQVHLGNAADLFTAIKNADQPITILRIGPGKDGKGEYVVLVKGTHGYLTDGEAWWGDHSNSWWSAMASKYNFRTVYVDRILEAVNALPEGATVHFAGHSQGGHAAQIAANELLEQGSYHVASITGFGSNALDRDLPGVAVTIYNSPDDPVHIIDEIEDTARITATSLVIGGITTTSVGILWGSVSLNIERNREIEIPDWSGHEYDAGRAPSLANKPLSFGARDGVTYAQYDTSEVNKVQKAVEFVSEKVAHTSSDAWNNVNNAVNKTAEATVNSGKQVGNIISTWIL
jgi:WXG100 family type VII secretion target